MKSKLAVLGLTLALVAVGSAGSACGLRRQTPPSPVLTLTDVKIGVEYEVESTSVKKALRKDGSIVLSRNFNFFNHALRPQAAPLTYVRKNKSVKKGFVRWVE